MTRIATAKALIHLLIMAICANVIPLSQAAASRIEVDLSGPGWHLWHDAEAPWRDDPLFLPPVDLSQVPRNEPTCGWAQLEDGRAMQVEVPGTVEGYLFRNPDLSARKPEDIYAPWYGVSWWFRTVRPPAKMPDGRLLLRFGAVRLRAEVYVNRKLVGYDVVGNTPFEVDITDAVQPGKEFQLAVRVTNPGGNHSWEDVDPFQWGDHLIPMGHAFGGITDKVRLLAVDGVYVDDIYVQNTPAIKDVNVQVATRNQIGRKSKRTMVLQVTEKANPSKEVFQQTLGEIEFAPGVNYKTIPISVPSAILWGLDDPNLYECQVILLRDGAESDSATQRFGFRWFEPDGIGSNATFRLNGQRIVLRSAISWGFWPGNGITPSEELAEKQIRAAKRLGLNMLNHHRCIGHPIALDKHDERGLLSYEEPGGYASAAKDKFAQALVREKLLRMIKRDRSRPSLVIYNMINESWNRHGADKDDALHAVHAQDMQDAHRLDPSRIITWTSGIWAPAGQPARQKMHMRPFDENIYDIGWYDIHRAGGPEVWREDLYLNPARYYGWGSNPGEISFFGEEGAMSAPPQLERIMDALKERAQPGWDGELYEHLYKRFADFLRRKQLLPYFHDVTALTEALGAVSLEHQGRKIQNFRINNNVDGYVINGWESQPWENVSGIVDLYRNPKADSSLLARYNQPLYLAVMPRQRVLQIPGEIAVDCFIVNEKDLQGAYTIEIRASDAAGRQLFSRTTAVKVTGGETYGELLQQNIVIPVTNATGMLRIEANLVDSQGKTQAEGYDEILALNWKETQIPGKGAVYEERAEVQTFLNEAKGLVCPAFDDTQGTLNWLVVARPPQPEPQVLDAAYFVNPDGKPDGLQATFYKDHQFIEEIHRRRDADVDVAWSAGATPDPAVPMLDDYAVRWEGKLALPVAGSYYFELRSVGGKARLWVAGKEVGREGAPRGSMELPEATPMHVRVEFIKGRGRASVQLNWTTPAQLRIAPERFLKRVREDGTTLVVLRNADAWAQVLSKELGITYQGRFSVGVNWKGGQYFVREHPLFKGLPVNQALNWPYQQVIREPRRYGLRMEGEKLVAGCYQSLPCELGTVVGIVPYGKGKVLFSTLDICPRLAEPPGPSDTARKLMVNYLEWARKQ